jgi:hypothetical protein
MSATLRLPLVLFFIAMLLFTAVGQNSEPGNTNASDDTSVTTDDGSTTPDAEDDGDVPGVIVKVTTRYTINDFGVVNVVDSWSGLPQESGVYNYISATRELGRIPVRVQDHKFAINFATRSFLISDEDDPSVVYLRTPTFFFESGQISLTLTLDLGNRLSFVEMMVDSPQPDSTEGSVFTWNIENANGVTLYLQLKRNKPFLVPGEGGPQFNPKSLPYLTGDEIPRNADEVLREFETIILVAEKEGAADPDFVKLLRKSLSKLYYIYYLYGLVTDYEPAPEKS